MDKGWISIHRKIVESPYYFSEPFTKMQAWFDMLIIANHKEGFFYKRGIKVVVKRGQIGHDLASLAKRWMWSRGKVERFLNGLESEFQIVRQKGNVTTLISIVNYDVYQNSDKANDKPNSKANGHQTVKQTVKQTDTNNNDNKNNNDNNDRYSLLVVRKQKFAESLTPFVSEFGREMIKDFYNYWTEPNKSKTKFKQELERTWDTRRRLQVWADRDFEKKEKNSAKKENEKSKVETITNAFEKALRNN